MQEELKNIEVGSSGCCNKLVTQDLSVVHDRPMKRIIRQNNNILVGH